MQRFDQHKEIDLPKQFTQLERDILILLRKADHALNAYEIRQAITLKYTEWVETLDEAVLDRFNLSKSKAEKLKKEIQETRKASADDTIKQRASKLGEVLSKNGVTLPGFTTIERALNGLEQQQFVNSRSVDEGKVKKLWYSSI